MSFHSLEYRAMLTSKWIERKGGWREEGGREEREKAGRKD